MIVFKGEIGIAQIGFDDPGKIVFILGLFKQLGKIKEPELRQQLVKVFNRYFVTGLLNRIEVVVFHRDRQFLCFNNLQFF